jgi:hypothetical protein
MAPKRAVKMPARRRRIVTGRTDYLFGLMTR